MELDGGQKVLEGELSRCKPSVALWITWVEHPGLEGHCIPARCWSAAEERSPTADAHL